MKKFIAILLCMSIVFSLCACGVGNTVKETEPPKMYTVVIDIDCESNFLLNRYDVAVNVDSEKIGMVHHGGYNRFVLELEEGKHEISFENNGDGNQSGWVSAYVAADSVFMYRISCGGSIDVECLVTYGYSEEKENLITNPSVAYIVECLKNVPTIIGAEAIYNAVENSSCTIYFSSDLLDQGGIYGDTVAEKGTVSGGSIDIYATVEDAEARNDYLAGYDGGLLDSGSHMVLGTLVIRLSKKLPESEKVQLQNDIVQILTSGQITEPEEYIGAWVADGSGVKVGEQEMVPPETQASEESVEETVPPTTIPPIVLADDETRVPCSSYGFGSLPYEDAVKLLENAGFTNIQVEPSYDLDSDWRKLNAFVDDQYTVSSISIGSATSFEQDDIFKKDVSIIVKYHDFAIFDPALTYTTYSADTLVDAFLDNALRAKEQHNDEYVIINGFVGNINSDGSFTLKPSYLFECSLEFNSLKTTLMDYEAGQKISIQGKIVSVYDFGYVIEVYRIIS